MENNISKFQSLTNCERLNIISDYLRKKIGELVVSNSFNDDFLNLAFGLINDIDNNIYHLPDNDCDCIDFKFYYKLIVDTINEVNDEKTFKEKFQFWEKAIATDRIINNIPRNTIEFNITGEPNLIGDSYYFDFNIYQYIENKELVAKINELNINVVYSPMHLEEVYRMGVKNFQDKRIQTITDLTQNRVVLNMDGTLKFYTEEPKYSYQRVLDNLDINEHVENNRVIKHKDRATFFNEIQNDKFKYIIDNQDIFEEIEESVLNQLLFFGGCFLKKEDFKKENKTCDEMLRMIYSLYDVLDNIGFSVDKPKDENRSLKSSIYDIEHLIYASSCDVLMTCDLKFSKRALQIYRFLNVNTKVIYFNRNENCTVFYKLLVKT